MAFRKYMKLNIIQKSILLVMLLLLIISFLFFIPIRGYRSTYIIYKSIFYTDGKIDFTRLVIQTLLIFLVGVFLLFSTSGVKNINWQSPSIKKIIKRELKFAGLFILSSTIICSIIYLVNFYQIKKRDKIEISISRQDRSQDSVSNLIKKNDLEKENFAYDVGQIISYSKDTKASYFEKLITNDFKGKSSQISKILQTGDAGYLPPPPAKKSLEITQTDEYGIPIKKKSSNNPFEDNINEKPYYIFDSIVNISNNNLDFIGFLNVIKGIKINDLKQKTIVLGTKKYQNAKINSSEGFEDFVSKLIMQDKKSGKINDELELYSIKDIINKLPYYQKLASEPKLFLEKINGLINTENTNIVEFNSLIDRTKLLKTKLRQTSFFDSNIIEQVYMIVTLSLFGLLFLVRYASYLFKTLIIYLK